MQVHICAVGRLRDGPEHNLITDYLQRFDRAGKALGLGPVNITEVEDKKRGGMPAEAILLSKAAPPRSLLCALDERGTALTSPDFANLLSDWRDQGQSSVTFMIGGADGLDSQLRAKADTSISFGPMVWPHMLARVMLAEQLYRAASILSGHPYHRA